MRVDYLEAVLRERSQQLVTEAALYRISDGFPDRCSRCVDWGFSRTQNIAELQRHVLLQNSIIEYEIPSADVHKSTSIYLQHSYLVYIKKFE